MYFPRAVFLAVYADIPAAQKILLTGSACPVCFTPEDMMGSALDEEVYELVVAAVNVTKKGHLNFGKCWTEFWDVV